jgi:hypothetical protein
MALPDGGFQSPLMKNFEWTWSEILCCGLKLLPVEIVLFSLNE